MAIDEKTQQRAKDIAYRFLSYRPRSRKEVKTRLKTKGFNDKIIESVLHSLEEYGYIDDNRFASDWARYRLENRPIGKRRLMRELREKGLSSDIITKALDEAYQKRDESEIARELVIRKIDFYKGLEYSVVRRRLLGFLIRRGFSMSTSLTVINEELKRPKG